jgi:hypothetical protein
VVCILEQRNIQSWPEDIQEKILNTNFLIERRGWWIRINQLHIQEIVRHTEERLFWRMQLKWKHHDFKAAFLNLVLRPKICRFWFPSHGTTAQASKSAFTLHVTAMNSLWPVCEFFWSDTIEMVPEKKKINCKIWDCHWQFSSSVMCYVFGG